MAGIKAFKALLMNELFAALGIVVIALAALHAFQQSRSRSRLLPPGPRRLPILNNLLNFPGMEDAVAISRLGAQWAYTRVMGMDVLYLNSGETAFELLDKRAKIYSDRPHLVFGGDMCGQNMLLPLMKYDHNYKLTRKWLQSALGPHAVRKWDRTMTEGATKLAASLVSDPEHFHDHIRQYTTSLILKILYGYTVTGPQDPYIRLAEEATIASVEAITQNRLVNFFPFLRFLPSWFPGTGFKRTAEDIRLLIETFANKPFEHVKRAMINGSDTPNLTSDLLRDFCTSPEEENLVKWSISAVYGGGSETTSSLLTSFILAMVIYPDCQKMAQAEIDKLMAEENVRLPTFQHREKLPYVNALVKECLRWGNPANFAVPHMLVEKDEYEGHRIPRNTICVANIWAMLHHPQVYPEPQHFNPERYLKRDGTDIDRLDPEKYAFGFGRRRCPGLHLAKQSNWLAIATILATTEISPIPGSTPTAAWSEAAIKHPVPFECTIRSRMVVH